jgi:ADP-glucose pyrophosphorylase
MDEIQVITQTLNSNLQRHIKSIQSYEVEITNMTAEIVRLQNEVEIQKTRAEGLAEELAQIIETREAHKTE